MDAKDLKDLTIEELDEMEKKLRKEMFNLRFQAVSGHVENPCRIKEVRRDVARVMTFSRMRAMEPASKEEG